MCVMWVWDVGGNRNGQWRYSMLDDVDGPGESARCVMTTAAHNDNATRRPADRTYITKTVQTCKLWKTGD
jgi:hypothetical protein